MAILKHISVKNANLAAPLIYLLNKHDENNNRPIKDENNNLVPRDNYMIESINCLSPDTFQIECIEVNKKYSKNNKKKEIKTHHFILSFDPKDVEDNQLTMEKAQMLGKELTKKFFDGHQALICTHDNGHNNSQNMHVHIIINSIKKENVIPQEWMEKKCEYTAGYKIRITKKMMYAAKKYVMEMCEREGLNQKDLLNPSNKRISDREYKVHQKGQKELDNKNKTIIEAGLTPKRTEYQTKLQELRDEISKAAYIAKSEEEFKKILLQKYEIEVTESRGKWGYKKNNSRTIRARKLGARYEKEIVLSSIYTTKKIIDISNTPKALENKGYKYALEKENVHIVAKTLTYLSQNGISGIEELNQRIRDKSIKNNELSSSISEIKKELSKLKTDLNNEYAYNSTRDIYSGFKIATNKYAYRQKNKVDIEKHEAARSALKKAYPEGNIPNIKLLKEKINSLQKELLKLKMQSLISEKELSELKTIQYNLTNMLYDKKTKDTHHLNDKER